MAQLNIIICDERYVEACLLLKHPANPIKAIEKYRETFCHKKLPASIFHNAKRGKHLQRIKSQHLLLAQHPISVTGNALSSYSIVAFLQTHSTITTGT